MNLYLALQNYASAQRQSTHPHQQHTNPFDVVADEFIVSCAVCAHQLGVCGVVGICRAPSCVQQCDQLRHSQLR